MLCSIEWHLIGRKKECRGAAEFIGQFPDIARCADACKERSSMFIHGIKSEGESSCFCETSAMANGTCNMIDEPNYDLYGYGSKGFNFRHRVIYIFIQILYEICKVSH